MTWAFVVLLASSLSVHAVSLSELRQDRKLTPKKFANKFEDFSFELHKEVQPAELFLQRKAGDCDDYAVLADHVLPVRGYETRLIHIRLAGTIAHAVCYVTEEKVYLDYNKRNVFFTLTKADPSLRAIAEKVADSLGTNWTSVSEFVYSYERDYKTITATVVRTNDPALDPPPRKAPLPSNAFNVD